jgi:hypothetical protein
MHQRISRLWFCVTLAVAISAAGRLLAIEAGPVAEPPAAPLYYGRTRDPTPVELTMQDKDAIVRFKIPKMYMTFSPNWMGGMQNVLVLEVVFPSMAPAGKRSLASPEVLVISVYSFAHTGADYNVVRLLRRNIDNEWTLVGRETDRFGKEYSVYVRRSNIAEWKNPDALVKEYLIPDDSPDGAVYLECLRERSNPFVGCQGLTTFGKNLSLGVSFRRTQLEKWREMLRATEELLISFKE